MDAARRLLPSEAALVVIDLQTKLLPAVLDAERVVKRTRLLLRAAATLGMPMLLTTQYAKGLGPTVPEVLELAEGSVPMDKTSFGCFGAKGFLGALAAKAPGRRSLLVCGIEAHICVAQTVLTALEKGYVVHLASDALSSRAASDRDVGLRRMERAGAVLSSTEMAIYELLGASDSAAFKALLPHLRERDA